MIAPDLRRYLAEYADVELADELREDVQRALADDAGARAEVERWRSLRRAAGRAMLAEPVPLGLAQRVHARLRPPLLNLPSIFRFGASGLAVAAALLIGFVVWPAGAGEKSIRACGFVGVYRTCAASESPHDVFGIRRAAPGSPVTVADIAARTGFRRALPDLSRWGWRLDGGCRCAPENSGVAVVHLYYRHPELPGRVVSTFAVDHRVKLCTASGVVAEARGEHGHYHATRDGDLGVVCWDDGESSYVLVGPLSEQELVRLADGLRLARDAAETRVLAGASLP